MKISIYILLGAVQHNFRILEGIANRTLLSRHHVGPVYFFKELR